MRRPDNGYCVYRVTNTVNGKVYIGKTKSMARRWVEHLAKSRAGSGLHLARALRKYGADKFVVEILSRHENEEEAYQEEVRQIQAHASTNKLWGYNLTSGGEGVRGLSDEGRHRLRSFARKRIGERNSFFGKHHTEEAKARIGAAPRPQGERHRMWGRHHTEATKEKMRLTKRAHSRRMPKEQRRDVAIRHAGERSSTAKVTNAQAMEIKAKRAEGVLVPQLMQEYGLSRSSVYKIASGATFRGISP